MARGLLLINLGTPDSPKAGDVRRYLREFLSDPRVLDINSLGRWLLLNLVILPRRPAESGRAYEKIWTDRGSPLRFHSQDLTAKVQERLGDEWMVELAMRYQNPSIASVLARFRDAGVDDIVVFPLFPQYSSAANGSAIEKVFVEAAKQWSVPNLSFVPPFYDHPTFLHAFTRVARQVLVGMDPDRVLFSFHGLPERHVRKAEANPGTHCLKSDDCCATITHANRNCYRAQCFATARGLAQQLNLPADSWEVAFQSRLGRDPWIRPYSDERVVEMAKNGTKKLAVLCPAFVADCLETIEEIGIRAKDDFEKNGGQELRLVPSLNAEDVWADAVVELATSTPAALSTR